MAESIRVHSRTLHLAARVSTGIFSVVTVFGGVRILIEGKAEPLVLGIYGFFVVMIALIGTTIWKTSAVWMTSTHLEVGRGRRLRRIPFADIVTIGRPWWHMPNPLFAPLEISLRSGPPVVFFPAAGAETRLRSRQTQSSP